MKKYTYHGPISGCTIGDREVMFHDGSDVELPEDNDYTRALVALGRLIEIPSAGITVAATPADGTSAAGTGPAEGQQADNGKPETRRSK